ncbi:MAG: 30S ribosomal protein S6 [Acidobacteriota bacterium]
MSHYELIWIAAPTLSPEDVERLSQDLEKVLKERGGTLLKNESWGRKRLAYKVRKHDEGYYVYYLIESNHTVVDELVRRIRMNDDIIKFLSVKVDLEALSKAGGRRQVRDERERSVQPGRGEESFHARS